MLASCIFFSLDHLYFMIAYLLSFYFRIDNLLLICSLWWDNLIPSRTYEFGLWHLLVRSAEKAQDSGGHCGIDHMISWLIRSFCGNCLSTKCTRKKDAAGRFVGGSPGQAAHKSLLLLSTNGVFTVLANELFFFHQEWLMKSKAKKPNSQFIFLGTHACAFFKKKIFWPITCSFWIPKLPRPITNVRFIITDARRIKNIINYHVCNPVSWRGQ